MPRFLARQLVRASLSALLFATPALLAQDFAAHRLGTWLGTWAASPDGQVVNPGQPSPANTTYREVVHLSTGGSAVRVELTNEFGTRPLTIGAAHIALSAGSGAIQAGSDRALAFNGQPSVIVPPGAPVFSDPVPIAVAPMADLAVSVYLPDQTIAETTCHPEGLSTMFITQGDTTAAETLSDARTIRSWCFVKAVDVQTTVPDAAAIVCLGDSITDGIHSTPDANRRWPDVLARRLQADPDTAHLSVLNEGISGNRLLHDVAGPSALARFDRDVLAQSGARYLILLEGINDIGHTTQPREPGDEVTTEEIIFALQQIVTRAHAHGLKVFGATLTPYAGAHYFSPKGEQMREAVNGWIRTSGVFDGVIDFDRTTRDPANPKVFLPAYDSGDHLHPNDAGYEKMGDSIDLSLFR